MTCYEFEKEITSPIKVIITDDHILYRSGVKVALASKTDIDIIAEADNGVHLLQMLKTTDADVILLDIQMPEMDGIATLQEIKKAYPKIKIIMLSMVEDNSMVTKLMELGANSYLTKTSDSEIIYDAIVTCYQNEYYFNSLTNFALIASLKQKNVQFSPKKTLAQAQINDKEALILRLMCKEKTTKEIADIVNLSIRTIEAIREKLKLV